MANVVKKNVEKGVVSTVVVALASILAIAVQQGAKRMGLDIDCAQTTVIITATIAGLIAAAQNWLKHRKKKKA